jgi:hypothetical protein
MPAIFTAMMPEFIRTLAGLSVLWLLQGCTQWSYELGQPLSQSRIPTAEDALSLTAVLAELGPPQRISSAPSGYVMAWEYWQVRENSLGVSLGAMGADFLSVDWGRANVSGEFLLLTFDREHRLSGSTLSQWSGGVGGGSAIQPFFGVVDVVEVGDLVGRMPQHRWGATRLLPLPEAINSASRPDMGDTGIQQRGTPTGVGQQSLEMD